MRSFLVKICLSCLLAFIAFPAFAQLTKEQIEEINRQTAATQAKERAEYIARMIATVEKATEKDLSPNTAIDILHSSLKLPAEEGIPIYQRFLTHVHPWVRQSCLRALGDHGAKSLKAAPTIFDIYKNDSQQYNHDQALTSLAKIGYLEADVIEEFENRLKHTDVFARSHYLQRIMPALQIYGPKAKKLLPLAQEILQESMLDITIRVQTYRAIGVMMDVKPPTTKEIDMVNTINWKVGDGGFALLRELQQSTNAERGVLILLQTLRETIPNYLRNEIFIALGNLGGQTPDAVTELLKGLESNNPYLMSTAHYALQKIPPKSDKVLELLVLKLKESESPEMHKNIVQLLAKWEERAKPATEAIITRLRKDEETLKPDLMLEYFKVLRKIGSPAKNAGRVVAGMFTRENFGKSAKFYPQRLRTMMLAALTDIGAADEAGSDLIDMLKPNDDGKFDSVQFMFAARALAHASSKSVLKAAVPLLLPALKAGRAWDEPIDTISGQDHFFVPLPSCTSARIQAIRALKNIGPEAQEAIPLLEQLAAMSRPKLPAHLEAKWPCDFVEEARLALKTIQKSK